jgi:hypothetical protein
MSLENGRDRFKRAIGILVDEQDRIKERLLVAYASQLSRLDPEHDLPQAIIPEFDELKNALSDAEMPYGYGERAATKLHGMSEEAASTLARTIYSIFLRLHELEPIQTPS